MELEAVYNGLVCGDRRVGSIEGRLGRIEILLGRPARLDELRGSLKVYARKDELGLVALQICLGLIYGSLEEAGVDDDEEIAGFDVLAFLEVHLGEDAVDLRFDLHGSVRLNVSERDAGYRDVRKGGFRS